jgi:hypothetical protein
MKGCMAHIYLATKLNIKMLTLAHRLLVAVLAKVTVYAKIGRHLRATHVTPRSIASRANHSDLLIDNGKISGISERTNGPLVTHVPSNRQIQRSGIGRLESDRGAKA